MFEFIHVKYKHIVNLPSLVIEEGKINTLFGPSGSGKTTILKMLNKMLSPTDGKILYQGQELKAINAVLHRREVMMLSQNPAIFEGNIRDNLCIGFKLQEKPLPADDVFIRMLAQVHLQKSMDDPVAPLSGGEKQRLALARILLLDAKVYLLDEPASALDALAEEVIIEMVTAYVKKHQKTLVMVTHSDAMAKKYSDVMIDIMNGTCNGRCAYERRS